MDNQIRTVFYTLLILYFIVIIMYGLVKQQNELLNKLTIHQGKTKLVFEHKYLPIVLRNTFRLTDYHKEINESKENYESKIFHYKNRFINDALWNMINEIRDNNLCEITDKEVFNSRQREIEVKLYLYKKENV